MSYLICSFLISTFSELQNCALFLWSPWSKMQNCSAILFLAFSELQNCLFFLAAPLSKSQNCHEFRLLRLGSRAEASKSCFLSLDQKAYVSLLLSGSLLGPLLVGRTRGCWSGWWLGPLAVGRVGGWGSLS